MAKKVTLSTGRQMPESEFLAAPRWKGLVRKSEGGKDRGFVMQISEISVDRDDEAISAGAWTKAWEKFKESPAVAIGHELDAAQALNIGRVTRFWIEGKAVMAEGYLGRTAPAQDLWLNLEDDIPQQASVAFYPLEAREATDADRAQYGEKVKRVYEDMDVLHFGVVNVGAHPKTFTRKKSLADILAEKGANGDKANALMDEIMAGANAIAKAAAALVELASAGEGTTEPDPNNPEDPPPPGDGTPAKEAATEEMLRSLLDGIVFPVVKTEQKSPVGSPPTDQPEGGQ